MSYYETFTFKFLMDRALARIPNTLDKREGSIIYDALAPACYELAEAYMELSMLLDNTFADTANGEFLRLRAAERGVFAFEASAAIRLGVFNLVVPLGSRFSIADTTYIVIENLAGFESRLQCEQVGTIGNLYTGNLMPITYIAGLTTAQLTTVLTPGEDEETDEALRLRYFENILSQPFGGNIADYKEKTKAIAGVAGVKVYPVWAGGGTVKLVIQDSTYGVPSSTLVDEVQEIIDPVGSGGEGLGLAPIGHIVTVAAVSPVTVNIASTITLASGYVWADVEPYIIEKLEAYLLQLKQGWENESAIVVRLSQIDAAIIQVTGVVDVSATQINGSATNLTLTTDQIPILGTVVG